MSGTLDAVCDRWNWDQWLGAIEVARLTYRPPKLLLRFSTVTSAPVVWWWGWRIGEVASALPQLEEMGLLESRWEDEQTAALRGGVQRRRLYRRIQVCPRHTWQKLHYDETTGLTGRCPQCHEEMER